jgi:hypothetical protein
VRQPWTKTENEEHIFFFPTNRSPQEASDKMDQKLTLWKGNSEKEVELGLVNVNIK